MKAPARWIAAAGLFAAAGACTRSSGLAALDRCEATGRLDGVQIEYWTGGGPPPPTYRSTQLRLLTEDAHDVVEVAELRRDTRFDPPEVQDRWRLPASAEDVRGVARRIREGEVLTRRYAEERDPGVADGLSTEVIVTAGGHEEKRRYHLRLPAPVEPLRAEVERLSAAAKAHGDHGVYHQGKRITD